MAQSKRRRRNKRKAIVTLRRYIGMPCFYCYDLMIDEQNHPKSPSRDHYYPRGTRPAGRPSIVICCAECNGLKGNRHPDRFCNWLEFYLNHRGTPYGDYLVEIWRLL